MKRFEAVYQNRDGEKKGTRGVGVYTPTPPHPVVKALHVAAGESKKIGNDSHYNLDAERKGRTGASFTEFSVCNGVRDSTARAFLFPALADCPNLFVLTHAQVTRVALEEKRAVGVYAKLSGKKEILLKARKEVILSAGAYHSPQLLMLSGIGPREHLESLGIPVLEDLPVGKNLQDHPTILLKVCHFAQLL